MRKEARKYRNGFHTETEGMTISIETTKLLATLILYLCYFIILGFFVKFSTTAYPNPRIRMVSENAPYENTHLDYVDYALPAGRLRIQPQLITVYFNNTWGYTMPASRIEDTEIWVHEFVESTIAWILDKMFGHHDFVLSVVNRNIKYKHEVIHFITSLFHISYMSMGDKRLSPNEYEDMMFGHDDNDKEED